MRKKSIMAEIRKEIQCAKVLRIEDGKAVIGVVRKDVILRQGGRIQIPARPFLKGRV